MENIITWISVAFNLAEKDNSNTENLEKAFKSFEKMERKFSEARALIGGYKDRENVSTEDIMTAQTFFNLTVAELKKRQRNLFEKTIKTCICSLKSLHKKSTETHGNLQDITKEIHEKIKDTKLDKNFAKAYPDTFRKLEKSVLRLRNLHDI